MAKKKKLNYDINLDEAKNLVEKEVEFEERRFENLRTKASILMGFVSIVIFLIFSYDSSLLSIYGSLFFKSSLVLLSLAVICSAIAYGIKEYKRPNVSLEDGLLSDSYMDMDENQYKKSIIKQFNDVLIKNDSENKRNAKLIKISVILFITGIISMLLSVLV